MNANLRVISAPRHGLDVAALAERNVMTGDAKFDAAFYAIGASKAELARAVPPADRPPLYTLAQRGDVELTIDVGGVD